MNVFEEIRKEYETKGLDRADLLDDPFAQFDVWFQEAISKSPGKWCEPNAMTLSTSAEGTVTSRTVLLKETGDRQFIFFTNYQSEKGQQLDANPHAALLFHWHYLGRQIRIDGVVDRTSREISEKYFHSRPRGAQLGAMASTQSHELVSREALDTLRQELDERYAGKPVPLPETWGGFSVRPQRFEFWQGRLDRLHDRFQFSNEKNGQWDIRRLFP